MHKMHDLTDFPDIIKRHLGRHLELMIMSNDTQILILPDVCYQNP